MWVYRSIHLVVLHGNLPMLDKLDKFPGYTDALRLKDQQVGRTLLEHLMHVATLHYICGCRRWHSHAGNNRNLLWWCLLSLVCDPVLTVVETGFTSCSHNIDIG